MGREQTLADTGRGFWPGGLLTLLMVIFFCIFTPMANLQVSLSKRSRRCSHMHVWDS